MQASGAFVDAPWRYERIEGCDHWVPVHAADRHARGDSGHAAHRLGRGLVRQHRLGHEKRAQAQDPCQAP